MKKSIPLLENTHLLKGAINTGVLISGDKALLIECGDSVTPDRLEGLGIKRVG